MEKDLPGSKPHYQILDGLRGVASVMVVAFHIFEANAGSHSDQIINHGYLAVDFFFLLSGFVIGYAYDDRWKTMSTLDFFKRRLTRLQPMVILGMITGAICFYFQDSVLWPTIHEVPLWKVILVMLVGFTLIPLPASMDIRGWTEMHPLNGPGWSLFYEYVANILYALFIRKFGKILLSLLVLLSAAFLIHLAFTSAEGDIIGGWSLEVNQIHIGFARLLYPFFAGLLLFRIGKLICVKYAFLLCSLLLVIVLAMPRVGSNEHLWMNGLYDAGMVILVFPLIVFLGAGGQTESKWLTKVCRFFGDISYPVYITHYPLIYIYTGWVVTHKLTLKEALPTGLLVFTACIAIGYLSLKLYDEPVRKWLKQKLWK
ncbi:MAG: acyltransferase family protein [Ferruginibacter sp.]